MTLKNIQLKKPKSLVLACTVIEQELAGMQADWVDLKFFDYGLHRTPENMAKVLQKEIDAASRQGDYEAIILGYGLCSNGIVGIRPRDIPLIVPKVHDCISLFLGSAETYREESAKCPGTYYLTPGWIDKGETPVSKYISYVRSYDEETAKWILHEEMKHYTRVVLINTGAHSCINHYRQVAQSNAEFLKVSYEELQGSQGFFEKLLHGPWGGSFLRVTFGGSIEQEMFLDI